jgi:hypothetical protein
VDEAEACRTEKGSSRRIRVELPPMEDAAAYRGWLAGQPRKPAVDSSRLGKAQNGLGKAAALVPAETATG